MAKKASQPAAETQASRRVKYGLNVTVAAIAAVALVVLLNWIGYRQFVRKDVTAGGQYSLSQQTRKVIAGLEDEYQIVTLLSTGNAGTSRARDLVDEYGRRSGKVQVDHIDPAVDIARIDAFFGTLKDRYGDRLEPMRQAIERGRGAIDELNKQTKDQVAILQEVLKDPALGEGDLPATVQTVARILARTGSDLETLKEALDKFLKGEGRLPNYTAARDNLRTTLSDFDTKFYSRAIAQFERLASAKETPASVKDGLLRAADLMKKSRASIAAVLPDLDKASAPEDYDQLSTQLSGQQNAVVVVGPKQVRVIALDEMFRRPTEAQLAAAQEDQLPERDFLGEERITGALISMGLKSPPMVVFVSGGRQPAIGPGGQFESVAQRLQKLNFKVEQWSPQGRMGPMGQPMPPGPPPTPEPGQKAVWIVGPIEPPNPMNPMMGGGGGDQIVGLVQERMAQGDSAMFMLNVSPMARFGGADPVAQFLETWGVKPQLDRIVLKEMVMPNRQRRPSAQLEIDSWPDALPITKALAGMNGIMLQAVPIETDTANKGVQIWPLVEITGPDLWAEKNLQSQTIKRDPATSAEKFTVAVAAEKDKSRLIVVGDPAWATDQITTFGYFGEGTAEMFGARFPANSELFVNGTFWLAGLDQLIAASARSQDIRRVRPISDGAYESLKWALLVGMPLATLATGVGVWSVRRRA